MKPYNKETLAAIKKIHSIMKQHHLGVVTKYSGTLDDELICDPLIWTSADLVEYDITDAQWAATRGFKTLHEVSCEHGWEVIGCIAADIRDEVTQRADEDEPRTENAVCLKLH